MTSGTELGPLWPSYCRPSEAALRRAAEWPDATGWLLQNLGDVVGLMVVLVLLQAVRARSLSGAVRLRGGPLGLSSLDLVALGAGVLLADLPFLVSPQNVVLWEIAADVGLFSAVALAAWVAHGVVSRVHPAWLAPRWIDSLLGWAAAVLCAVLLLGGFVTAWLPASWGVAGPRWPLLGFFVSAEWWVLGRLRRVGAEQPAAWGSQLGRRRQNVTLGLVSLALALLSVEVGARWMLVRSRYDVEEAASVAEAAGAREARVGGAAAVLSRLVAPSANPRLVYRLRGELDEEIVIPHSAPTRFRTNSFGMRGPETPLAKPAGTIRIAALGDSVTFGWGVAYDESLPAVLGRVLEERDPGRKYEVLNFGVPGYNTVMQRESFRELASRFAPDLVVLTVVANDADLPNFLQRPRNALCLHRAFLSGLLRRSLGGADPYAAREILVAQSHDLSLRIAPERGLTPAGSERLSGRANALGALRALHEDVIASGAKLLVTADFDDLDADLDAGLVTAGGSFQEEMLDGARQAGIPVADPREHIVAHLRDHGLRSEDLWVAPRDRHPDSTRHRLMAESLVPAALILLGGDPEDE